MAERRAIVIDGGRLKELPAGDTLAGVPGVSTWKEPATVWNDGNPEVLFDQGGDVVMLNAS